MKMLNEPIGTWIAIAALFISLFTLLLTIRKQKHEERTALANKITEIKARYGEFVRRIDELLEKYDGLEYQFRQTGLEEQISEHLKSISHTRSYLQSLRSKSERIYSMLGHETPRTTDPVVLSAVAVEVDGFNTELEDMADKVGLEEKLLEAVIKQNSKNRILRLD